MNHEEVVVAYFEAISQPSSRDIEGKNGGPGDASFERPRK
jgi:hypothetical protein